MSVFLFKTINNSAYFESISPILYLNGQLCDDKNCLNKIFHPLSSSYEQNYQYLFCCIVNIMLVINDVHGSKQKWAEQNSIHLFDCCVIIFVSFPYYVNADNNFYFYGFFNRLI